MVIVISWREDVDFDGVSGLVHLDKISLLLSLDPRERDVLVDSSDGFEHLFSYTAYVLEFLVTV